MPRDGGPGRQTTIFAKHTTYAQSHDIVPGSYRGNLGDVLNIALITHTVTIWEKGAKAAAAPAKQTGPRGTKFVKTYSDV